MFTSASIEEAAEQAKRLRDSGHLAFVRPGSHYAIRPSSRRETDLLQRFFASCNRSEGKLYQKSDFDGLLTRRSSLLMAFFAGLYLAPEILRKRLAPNGVAGAAKGSSSSGSGGQESQTSTAIDLPASEASSEEAHKEPVDAIAAETDLVAPSDSEEGDAIDNSSQEDALAAILGSKEANDGGAGRDQQIDLGDEFL